MKRIVIALAVVSLFVLPLFADIDLNVFGGYTTLSMGKVNDAINRQYDALFSPLFPITKSKIDLGNGFIVGLDAGYSPIPGLSIGPRVEFLGGSGDLKAAGGGMTEEIDFNASMIPILIGAAYTIPLSGAFSIGGGIYLGYGLGYASEKFALTGQPTETVNADGGSFAGDINIDAKYKISDMFNLGIKLGYRLADVSEMKATADNAYEGIKKGDVLKDDQNNTLPIDYSGLVAGVDLGFAF